MDWTTAANDMLDLIQDTFGESVVYKPLSGTNQTVSGVFGSAYVAVSVGDGAPTSSVSPTLLLTLSDLSAKPKAGDRVEIRGTDYRVIDSQEDGEGGVTLMLHK